MRSPSTAEEAVMEAALEAGAEDIEVADDGSIEVHTAPEEYHAVVEAMTAAGMAPEESELTMRATTEVALDVEAGQQVLKFLDVLEDLDDTQNVYSNADIPDEAYGDDA